MPAANPFKSGQHAAEIAPATEPPEASPNGNVWARLRACLDAGPVRFWWRDDDATKDGPQLRRLLGLAERHRIPLALAVIPAGLSDSLAAVLDETPPGLVTVVQHGWDHSNNAASGRNVELSDDKGPGALDADLRHGWDRLVARFGDRLQPVMVPPWNRIDSGVAGRLPQLGIRAISGLSSTAATLDPRRIDVHLDVIDWSVRSFRGAAPVIDALEAVLAAAAGSDGPRRIGLMTHHRDHDPATWEFLDRFFTETLLHPNAGWTDLRALVPHRENPA